MSRRITNPIVSIIVPTYNGSEKCIEDCIASLLDIDYPKEKIEIIIVDDGSTHDLLKKLKQYPVKVIAHKTNLGMSIARNTGIRNARGTIIAMTDDDATVPKDWLNNIIKEFEPDVGAVGGQDITFPDSSLFEKISGAIEDVRCIRRCVGEKAVYFIRGVNCAFLRDAIKQVGGFDKSVISCNETDTLFRILKKGYRITYDPSIVVHHHRRSTLVGYMKQYIRNGRGDFSYSIKNLKFQVRHGRLWPPIVLIIIALLGTMSLFSRVALNLFFVVGIGVFAYIFIKCAIFSKRKKKWTWLLLLVALYSLRNICLGVGFLMAMVDYLKRGKL